MTDAAAPAAAVPRAAGWVCPGLDARTLADHLEDDHHRATWDELHRLAALADEAVGAEGPDASVLARTVTSFDALRERFAAHLRKEERLLFPMVRDLAATERRPSFHCGSLRSAIDVFLAEHDAVEAAFDALAASTNGYTAPAGASPAHRALVAGLAELDGETRVHLRTEGEVLFPEVLRLERRVLDRVTSHFSG